MPVRQQAITWTNADLLSTGPLRNKLQWNLYQNTNLLSHGNAFESVVCEMAALLSMDRWVNTLRPVQNGWHSVDMFKWICLNGNFSNLIQILLKFYFDWNLNNDFQYALRKIYNVDSWLQNKLISSLTHWNYIPFCLPISIHFSSAGPSHLPDLILFNTVSTILITKTWLFKLSFQTNIFKYTFWLRCHFTKWKMRVVKFHATPSERELSLLWLLILWYTVKFPI